MACLKFVLTTLTNRFKIDFVMAMEATDMKLSKGDWVFNFNTLGVVVGFFSAAHGVSEMDGWPILREVGPLGTARGGKWVADPSKCTPAPGKG